MKIKLNIQKKLVVLLLVFALLPLAATMPIVFSKLGDMEQARLEGMQKTTATLGETIDRNLFERYGDVQAFGVNGAAKDTANWYSNGADNSLISAMNAYMTNYGLYKVMMLVDTNGKVAAVNSVNNKGKELPTAYLYDVNFKEASWFKKTMNKEFVKTDALDGTYYEQPKYDADVAKIYGEDGFTIPFAAPVYDASGNIMAVWVNFADFGLIEDIAKAFYAEAKTRGETKNAYAIQAEDGTALLDYDPTATGTEDYKRDTTAIGVKTLAQMELPAADVSLKEPSGVELHNHHGDIDGAAWTKTDGAMGFAGFNWIVINHQPSEELFADLVATKQLLITLMVIAAIAIAVVGLVVGTLAARPIKKLALDINNLAEGDYTRDLDGANRSDEIGDMVKSLNNNVHKIREIVSSIKHAAGSVNAAASEIAAGSSDLSMRTEQQASSLEETAASMEEITGTVKQNSENAVHANNLSGNANKVATEGGRVVEEAVVAMKSIESSSQKISDIISVIDEIAFQTNLLALNAAVEAARAGDAGKGFAVVASEVRALAGRSASASKEIKALINESASQVKTGASLVNQAGDTLKGIVTSIKEVAGIVSEISSASMQQSTGIDEINSAVSQMDEATQQNAALVEENTAAAQSMLEQAKALENLITFFKVEEGAEVAHEETHTPEPIKTFKPAVKKVTKPAVKKPAAKVTPHVNGHVNGGSHDAGWEQF